MFFNFKMILNVLGTRYTPGIEFNESYDANQDVAFLDPAGAC